MDKTKEQERDFIISFEGTPVNFKGTYQNARFIIDSTEHFYHRPSSLTVQYKVAFIQAKGFMLHM